MKPALVIAAAAAGAGLLGAAYAGLTLGDSLGATSHWRGSHGGGLRR